MKYIIFYYYVLTHLVVTTIGYGDKRIGIRSELFCQNYPNKLGC